MKKLLFLRALWQRLVLMFSGLANWQFTIGGRLCHIISQEFILFVLRKTAGRSAAATVTIPLNDNLIDIRCEEEGKGCQRKGRCHRDRQTAETERS